jgi:hypothetical protein
MKIADLMADNRLTLSDWKYTIPFYLTRQPNGILIVSSNFAEGIRYQHAKYGFDIPAEFVVAYPEDTMINIDGKEYRG